MYQKKSLLEVSMPFILKEYPATKGEKVQLFLIKDLNLSPSLAQNLLDRKKVFDSNMNSIKKSDIISTNTIFISKFEGSTRGLKPIFSNEDFALFDKPSGVMVHPVHKFTPYSLLDEVKYHFGDNANIVHRIDAETSGLVLISKNKKSEIDLKTMFENKEYKKEYLAITKGVVKENLTINKALKEDNNSLIRVKMKVSTNGKESLSDIFPLKSKDNNSLVKIIPHTGRQHQIRVHLDSINNTILGDPIYGVDEKIADMYLSKTLLDSKRVKYTNSYRLWLHAYSLEFNYKEIKYKFYSKNSDIIEYFNNL